MILVLSFLVSLIFLFGVSIGFRFIVSFITDKVRSMREDDRAYKDRVLKALERGEQSKEVEDTEEESVLENLIESNKKIIESDKIKQAMKDELGVE